MSKPFSRSFKTFKEWKDQAKNTPYKKKMERLHSYHPQASLSQLRGHSRKSERLLGKLKKAPPSKMSWRILKPKEKMTRHRSLDVLTLMRNKGYSLSKASKEIGVSPSTVVNQTNGLKKVGNRWILKRNDSVSREMSINSNGKTIWVEVTNSYHASTIGRYNSAVGKALESGDESYLKPFRGKRIKDSEGNWHTLETDLHTLYEIQERKPHEEFFMIYKTQGGW